MPPIPEPTLERLAEMVHRHLGLYFPRERWRDLARGVEATCRDLGEEVEVCSRRLLSSRLDRRMVEVLGRNLTIGETYFFREEQAYRVLEKQFLPDLILRRRKTVKHLRLWSAACATGEEPYSLAILLRTQIPDIEDWQITILGTDINPDFLRKAEAGVFGNWSFRNPREGLRERWFVPSGKGLHQIRPEIRKMVTFFSHNLVEDPYPSLANNTNAMDVIFCRNVLMYFSEEKRRHVMEHLQRCLVEDGLLFMGAAESSSRASAGLTPVMLPSLILYQKRAVPARPTEEIFPFVPAPRPQARPSPPLPSAGKEPPDLLDWLSRTYRAGDYVSVCRRAVDLKTNVPGFASAALVAARACANTGSLKDALSWVDASIAAHRFEAEAHFLRAMILDELGRTSEALDELRTTLYLNVNFISAYVAQGNISRREGDRKQAERNYRNALALLEDLGDEEPVPHTEEMRAGRLREAVIAAMGGA